MILEIIKVHDQIDSYKEKMKLADLINNSHMDDDYDEIYEERLQETKRLKRNLIHNMKFSILTFQRLKILAIICCVLIFFRFTSVLRAMWFKWKKLWRWKNNVFRKIEEKSGEQTAIISDI